MADEQQGKSPLSPELGRQLDATRAGLLNVHKALLDEERVRYERVHDPVGGSIEFLRLTISDPWFAWLHPLSELIVQIDEVASAKEGAIAGAGEALIAQARRMLQPDENGDEFQRQYYRALQEAPAVGMAHAEWKLAQRGS